MATKTSTAQARRRAGVKSAAAVEQEQRGPAALAMRADGRSLLPTLDERRAWGRDLRTKTSRGSHAAWAEAPNRADPIALLEAQAATRVPELVPIRYARMSVS